MDFKRILRGPIVWVVLIVGHRRAAPVVHGAGGFTRIDTSAAEKLINDGKVQSAKLDVDKVDQLTLKKGESYSDGDGVKDANRVQAYYIAASAATASSRRSRRTSRRTATPTRSAARNWFGSLLVTVIPLVHRARPVLVPDEPDAGRRLEGHELRQVQGQAGRPRTRPR